MPIEACSYLLLCSLFSVGVLVGDDVISTENAFYMLVGLNIIAVPLGTLAMQPAPGCCAADNRNAEKRALAAARLAAAGTPQERVSEPSSTGLRWVCAQLRLHFCAKPAAALYEFLAAFRTCRAYRLSFLRGFVGSLNPFGIFGYYW